ncbi:MAG: class I SAM-dependent methyltransferase [Candidatus Omnitrophica bacterium]|nr:class I SAM-dependent methyltransferase [Candidatus Omnitrophota bacterium]
MDEKKTREPQYQITVDLCKEKGLTRLGLMTNQVWHDDPRRMLFILARYKFVAKMLSGKGKVLEVGCGDAFGTRIVLQEVGMVCAVDFDPVFIEDVNERMEERWEFECKVHDILSAPVEGVFDAAYSIDVIEHIPSDLEWKFMQNVVSSLSDKVTFIIGVPSSQSQEYASESSRKGHVNCKDYQGLDSLMKKYFHNIFIFSMNDEVVHTGFSPMAHYLFAIGVNKKQ